MADMCRCHEVGKTADLDLDVDADVSVGAGVGVRPGAECGTTKLLYERYTLADLKIQLRKVRTKAHARVADTDESDRDRDTDARVCKRPRPLSTGKVAGSGSSDNDSDSGSNSIDNSSVNKMQGTVARRKATVALVNDESMSGSAIE
jgi:hypothetical protein